jgi:2-polyprenyl-3-methyl-5-hydroxy-6-metoxy-1,4-benzoquinol methylase
MPRFILLACLVLAPFSVTAQQPAPEREPDVPYVPTPVHVVMEMLKLANVGKDDVVYDLGCGDGRIVITAAKELGARGVGVDINPERIKEANENAKKAGVANRVTFRQEDLFKTDIHDATVMMLYLLTHVNIQLKPRLLSELKPGTRVVSNTFGMGTDWKADKEVLVDGRTLFLWTIPAKQPVAPPAR